IASSAHLSPSYSSALFKESTGSSIIDYIINLRIAKACDMLKYSDRRISEIAESAGFCDIFYFSRMFKKHMGVSPAKYRASEKENFY
ncbi:MAG: helix-turn-helix domain-containing protein, partial [Eubacteriales bacterium]